MENEEKEAGKEKWKQKKEGRIMEQGQYRVVISKEANQELEWMVTKVIEGMESVTMNKSDVAEYVFKNMERLLLEADFKSMRSLYFDEKKVLGSIMKRANVGGDLPEEIKKALREHCGLADVEKKRRGPSAA